MTNQVSASYEQRYVAYLDILGYSDLLRENEKPDAATKVIEKLRDSINKVLSFHRSKKSKGYQQNTTVRVLSDAVLISAPLDDDGCFAVVWLTVNVISGLAFRNIWVRGALTRGWHYDDGQVLFSPAMLKAYLTERDEAFYPRVLVDLDVVADCRKVGSTDDIQNGLWKARRHTLEQTIWRDHDARHFLNYLHMVDPQRLRKHEAEQKFMQTHRDHITERLNQYQNDFRKAAKYAWLANYHDRFCQQLLSYDEAARYVVANVAEVPILTSLLPNSKLNRREAGHRGRHHDHEPGV